MNFSINNILNIIKKIISDDLFRSGSLVFFAIILSSAFFYLNNIFLGRILGIVAYGEFGALFALTLFLQFILLKSVTIIDARSISKLKGLGKLQIIPRFHRKMLLYVTIIGVVAFVIFLLISKQIAFFLHIDSILLVILIGIIFLFWWPLSVNCGTIQGLQRFKHVAIINILPAALKFTFSVGLVVIGFSINGAIGGLVIGIIISLIISFYLLKDIVKFPGINLFSKSITKQNKPISDYNQTRLSSNEKIPDIKEVYKFLIPVLFAVVCIAIPTNIDVVLIKHFFTAKDTGLFTAVTVFGRMIFAFPLAIVTVMFPKIVEIHAKKEDTEDTLKRSLLYTLIPTGLIVILFYLFPKFFIGIFFGDEYINAAPLLQLYIFFIFFFSLITVLLYNSLAKNRYLFVYIFTAFSILEIGLIWLYHSSIVLIIEILLLINIISFIIGIYINYSYTKPKMGYRKNKIDL